MPSDKAIASLNKVLAKLQAKIASPPDDVTDEEIAELRQSISDIEANLSRWG
jgi:hypothetical protein